MIIKRWNEGTTSFEELHPKTKAQLIYNATNDTVIFDQFDKIKANFLPDTVFDGLTYGGTVSAALSAGAFVDFVGGTLTAAQSGLLGAPIKGKGYYWVISATGTIAKQSTVVEGINNPGIFARWEFRNTEGTAETGGLTTGSGVLEVGDWIVIDSISGQGTEANPYVITFSAINNTYELAATDAHGIVQLSDATAYADLSGGHVVTEGVLKTVIDNAAFAAGNHVHGNITNDGKITTNTAAASGQHLVITSTGNVMQQSAITFGSTETSFLNNAGEWTTPTGTYAHPAHPSHTIDTDGVEVLDTFTSDTSGHVTGIAKRTLPNATTSAAGVMSSADKTKLDGIATGANNYVHPDQALTEAAGVKTTLSDITLVDSLTTNSTGHLTNATWRKLVAGSNVSITAAANGNITIASTDTNTTYTAKALGGLSLDGTAFQMVHPFFVQTATPSTPLPGTVWYDIN
jgi:hypothetical protein